ncbi:putative glycoside hydrolase [Thaumasiovibrio subtropicus]|uniref:putative glycoside hydrolase n=1 Tax=Thaumasiovibrio subtropicus TaxID=1891207 RepID=UPI000B3629CB|nr:putative glycoside hydrolase [Thaumasiovibrio subtropicus]
MKHNKSYLALLIAASVGLTGCLSDNHGPKPGGGNPGGDDNQLNSQVPMYYRFNNDANHPNPYVFKAVDSTDFVADVDGEPNAALENIQVTGDFIELEPLTVTVSEDSAKIIFEANDLFDVNNANNYNADNEQHFGGTVQLLVNTHSYEIGDPQNPNRVYLSMGSGEDIYSYDITGAMVASANANNPAQLIRVPLNCFIDEGLDLAKVDLGLAIQSEGALSYDISQVRMASNSTTMTPSSNHLQGCFKNEGSKVLTTETAHLNRDQMVDGSWTLDGEAQNVRYVRGKSANITFEGTAEGAVRARGIEYNEGNFDKNRRSILTYAIEASSELGDMAYPRLDISHYMQNGELQMTYISPQASTMPADGELELVVQMYTPGNNTTGMVENGYENSIAIAFNLTEANMEPGTPLDISIPVRDLFTSPNGAVKFNTLQYIEKIETHIQQVNDNGDIHFNDLEGFRYGLADIKLVMNPEAAQ